MLKWFHEEVILNAQQFNCLADAIAQLWDERHETVSAHLSNKKAKNMTREDWKKYNEIFIDEVAANLGKIRNEDVSEKAFIQVNKFMMKTDEKFIFREIQFCSDEIRQQILDHVKSERKQKATNDLGKLSKNVMDDKVDETSVKEKKRTLKKDTTHKSTKKAKQDPSTTDTTPNADIPLSPRKSRISNPSKRKENKATTSSHQDVIFKSPVHKSVKILPQI